MQLLKREIFRSKWMVSAVKKWTSFREEKVRMKMNIIHCFNGQYAFLSNFTNSPISSNGKTVDGRDIFQAAKTLDDHMCEEIRIASTPDQAKRLRKNGSSKPDWEEMKKGGHAKKYSTQV